jgi:hypothetical protein
MKALSRHPPDAGFADRGFVFTEKAPLVEDCCTWAILAVFLLGLFEMEKEAGRKRQRRDKHSNRRQASK